MKSVKPAIKYLPYVMLVMTMLSALYQHTDVYRLIYPYLGQVAGYSLFTNIFFLYFCVRHKMCIYTFISILGLFCCNVIDILFPIIEAQAYATFFTVIVTTFFTGVSTYFIFRENLI